MDTKAETTGQAAEQPGNVLTVIMALDGLRSCAERAVGMIREANELRNASKMARVEAVVGLNEADVLARLQKGGAQPSQQAQLAAMSQEAAAMANQSIGEMAQRCAGFLRIVGAKEAPPPASTGGGAGPVTSGS